MFGKIITEMVTPFDSDDNINYKALKNLVSHLIRNHSSSLVINGIAGEGATLQNIEKKILIEKTLEYVNGKIPVIVSCGTNCTYETMDFIKKIAYLDVSGIMVIVPNTCQEGIYAHYKKLADSTNKPILIYNNSAINGVDISIKTIRELAKIKNIYGYIEANQDLTKIKQLHIDVKHIKIYISDLVMYEGLINGANGVLSTASQIYGKTIHLIYQLIRTKQYEDALALFEIYLPKFTALQQKPSPVSLKTALNRLELLVGSVRLPLVEMNDEVKFEFYKTLGI